ncbi:hypothetical protein KM043_015001 [Ampulex compressa]|nr:hypothetical protein KM043_015001 [Ampulex compressa]
MQRASCTNRHLYSIHTGAPVSVRALDLSNNSISSLSSLELANAGLTRLRYLNVSGNSISEIGLNAFEGLPDLTVLDLSRNHLYYILDDIFFEHKNLRVVKLSKNNFNSHVPKLQSPWLTELSVDSCQISHLPLDTFNGLPNLRNLDLSNNFMIQLDSAVLQTPHFLRKLSLAGNPWSCNGNMYDLEANLKRRGVEFIPVCGVMQGPKKFEKMILLQPVLKLEKHRISSFKNKKLEEDQSTVKRVSIEERNSSLCEKVSNEQTKPADVLHVFSQYWFLAIGFILGSACTMMICYVWLNQKSYCQRLAHRDRAFSDVQRVSLLQDVWQFDDPILSDNTNQTISCPGTPPPPYRDVVLRPLLYRTPATAPNLNNNIVRHN